MYWPITSTILHSDERRVGTLRLACSRFVSLFLPCMNGMMHDGLLEKKAFLIAQRLIILTTTGTVGATSGF